MNTPISDYLKKYSESNILRCHMPGHKGRIAGYERDITEISGSDSLFEAEGIIAESEKNMSRLYGTAATVYSAGGSTLCIQAMLAIMKQEGRKIIAVRNVHRAFLNAAALLDLEVEWIIPRYSGGILSGEIPIEEVKEKLKLQDKPCCLYVTSPDYTGRIADIKGLGELCRKFDARLLVDNAHGAHLPFFEENLHPIALGADLCCDSAHKMLPALTGAAMLHTSREEYSYKLKQAMSLFGSTSPSYLIMESLDRCVDYIENRICRDIVENLEYISRMKAELPQLVFGEGDPFHITVRADKSGMSGSSLAENLRKREVECEYSDENMIILLMSTMNCGEDYIRLKKALRESAEAAEKHIYKAEEFYIPVPETVMSIRGAVFSTTEEIPVENSEGRICASVKVPCPPAIPIAVSGEIIRREHINIFKSYGISTVNVIK